MSTITVDSGLKSLLESITTPTELRDESGHLIGTFTPSETDVDFDDAEFEKRRKSTHPGYSLEEVKSHLRSLERSA